MLPRKDKRGSELRESFLDSNVTVQLEGNARLETVYAGSSHIGTREYQQDSTGAGQGFGDVLYGVVCDGMGGLEGGELASRTAADAFVQALSIMDPACDIPGYLTELAHQVNALVYALPSQTGSSGASGTTLAAAVMAGNSLYWISVGDSRIYIIREQEIACVTRDHAYSLELDELVRSGRLSPEDAAADPRRDALISFLGMERLEMLDYNRNPFVLAQGDIVLLCSDGLYRSLSESEILEVVKRHRENLDECARVLPIHAFDRAPGSHDNTSVILLRYY